MGRKNIILVALAVTFAILLSTSFITSTSSVKTAPIINPSASGVKAARTLSLQTTPSTPEIHARNNSYAVYKLNVSSDVSIQWVDFDVNLTTWSTEFLNLSGVPLTDNRSNEIETTGTDYYCLIYVKVKVPGSISNGTSLTQRIYANASDSSSSSVDITTTCDKYTEPTTPLLSLGR